MRFIKITITFLLLFVAQASIKAQGLRIESFPVSGNCGMCKKTIEAAAKAAGASVATWNAEKAILKIGFNPTKTTRVKIEQAIAAKGYDTKNVKGNDSAYANLPACCQYDRDMEYAPETEDKQH
jgi:periplasmic mercuric ion binding protein